MKKIFSFLLLGLLLSVGNAWADQETITLSEQGYTNGQVISSTEGTVVTLSYEKGTSTTAPAYYNTGTGVRVYAGGRMIITADDNTITGVTVTFAKNNSPTISMSSNGTTTSSETASPASWVGSATEVYFVVSTSGHARIQSVAVTYTTGGSSATSTTVTIDDSGITNTDVYTSTEAGSLSATVKAGEDDIQGAVVTWSGNNDAVATIDANGAVTLVAEGTVTFTAAYAGVEDEYQASSKTYQMTVTNSDPNAPGTENNPFSVAQAIAATPASGTSSNVYIHGIVSSFYNTSIVGDGNNYRYYISDDGTTTNQLLIFKGKGLNNVAFSNVNDLLVGDEITIVGGLTMYQSAPEVAANNYIVSLDRPAAAPVINANNVNIAYDATSGEIAYTISNATEATLTATSSTPWISNIQVAADKVTFTTTANEGDIEREGFITLSYTGAENKVITITQAHYVPDYATLPFEWAGGAKEDLLAIPGVTAYELGSDYGNTNAPYLVKFDNTNDYIQVKTDSQPAKVTIGVKMIGGANASSISVQESADGTNFSEVQLLAISGNQNSTHTLATTNNFAATTRFVKMVFTKGSNVGVGPISIAAVTNDPSVVVEETSINVPYTGALDGVINVTYNNITEIEAEVAFFESDGTTPLALEPDWIVTDIDIQTHNLVYVVDVNEGAARTAYLKVYALDDEANEVYSELITITQAACAYAVLPFFFDDGRADIENHPGLTQEGLDSDYGSSPKLKFNTTGDYLVLRLNENAGVLSFDIKGNSFEDGTFSVQVSNDGSNYSNLDEFTALASTANMAYSLAAGVRYIKWIYTEKSAGNVALGNIKVRRPADATITLGTNGWSTYAIDYTCTLSGAEVYKAAYDELQNAVVLTEVENAVVPAGEGIILKGTEGASVTITPSAETASDFTDNQLYGTVAATPAPADSYVLATFEDGTKFNPCDANLVIPANKAYLVIAANSAPVRVIFAEDNATNIWNVKGSEKAVKFIENGKLYILREGVVYDATGRMVK